MTGKSFKELFKDARKRDEYWVADAILSFTEDLHEQAERKGKSRADLARALGVSTAYITKVFRGNTNFTIETMVKLARAVGARMEIHVVPEETRAKAKGSRVARKEGDALPMGKCAEGSKAYSLRK
jgi:transcriptional regulator with XRE-family HTH domain